MTRKQWTSGEMAVLTRLYADTPSRELAQRLGCTTGQVYRKAQHMGLRKSERYLNSPAAGRLDGTTGRACRFKKGDRPHNKGMTGWQAGGRSKKTQFKEGVRMGKAAALYLPVGSERIVRGGYLQRKVNDDMPFHKRWKMVHHLVWEEHQGPIPKGHVVAFRNGDKTDLRFESLELIGRAENMRRNTLHRYPAALKRVIRMVGKLRRKIHEKKN